MIADPHYLEHELYEEVQRGRSIFDFLQLGSLDGIWYWDIEAPEHQWCSPRFWDLLGFDPAEKQPLASEWQELIFPEDLEVALRNFTKHCEDPSHPYDQIVRYRHKDGSTVWVRCRGIAIRDANGKPLRLLGAHTDLTPQKRAEERLAEKKAEMEAANLKLREALDAIEVFEKLLIVCSHCRKIRGDDGTWQPAEHFIRERAGSEFSHGFCPECAKTYYGYVEGANPDSGRDAATDESGAD